jgi:hypothetical protein
MEEHELEHIVAAILTTAVFTKSPQPATVEAAVQQFREVLTELRREGLAPKQTLPHD